MLMTCKIYLICMFVHLNSTTEQNRTWRTWFLYVALLRYIIEIVAGNVGEARATCIITIFLSNFSIFLFILSVCCQTKANHTVGLQILASSKV